MNFQNTITIIVMLKTVPNFKTHVSKHTSVTVGHLTYALVEFIIVDVLCIHYKMFVFCRHE